MLNVLSVAAHTHILKTHTPCPNRAQADIVLVSCHELIMHTCLRVAGVAVLEGPMYAVGGHDGWSYLSTVER